MCKMMQKDLRGDLGIFKLILPVPGQEGQN